MADFGGGGGREKAWLTLVSRIAEELREQIESGVSAGVTSSNRRELSKQFQPHAIRSGRP